MVTFSFFFPEVKIFVALEQRNFSLLTYVNALNREIEALDKQNRQLKDLLLGDLKGYLKGYLWILGICANWLVFGFARSSMDGRQAELQEQLANQQEIEADSVNLNVREWGPTVFLFFSPMQSELLIDSYWMLLILYIDSRSVAKARRRGSQLSRIWSRRSKVLLQGPKTISSRRSDIVCLPLNQTRFLLQKLSCHKDKSVLSLSPPPSLPRSLPIYIYIYIYIHPIISYLYNLISMYKIHYVAVYHGAYTRMRYG